MIDYRMTANGSMEIHAFGKFTREEVNSAWSKIKKDLPTHGKVRLLEVIHQLDGAEPEAIWQDFKRGMPMMHRVDRHGLVSDYPWKDAFAAVGDVFTSAEVRTFELNEIEDARTWLNSG